MKSTLTGLKESMIGLQRFFSTNQRHIKLLALAAAVMFWFIITSQQRTQKILNGVPCNIQEVTDNLVLVDRNVSTLVVKVKGFPNTIYNLAPESVSATIRLPEDLRAGPRTINIATNMINLPAGVEVLDIQPPMIEITMENKLEAMVPVLPDVRGRLKGGLALVNLSTTPAAVKVTGAESAVSGLRYIHTEPIDITGKSADVKQSVALKPASSMELLEFTENKTVVVNISIREVIARRIVQRQVTASDADVLSAFNPLVVDVVVEGPRMLLPAADNLRILAPVDGLPPGVHKVRVLATGLPKELSVLAYIPEQVEVTVTAGPDGDAPAAAPASSVTQG
ncbi:YbbR-like domain-containing protein [bacterium]|nr:YbbR-like domain-containing protein [candidate division CSSED10-310 bacterium]